MAAKTTPEQELALALKAYGFAPDTQYFFAKTQKEDDAAYGLQEFMRTIGGWNVKRSGNFFKFKKGKIHIDFNMENAFRKTSFTIEMR